MPPGTEESGTDRAYTAQLDGEDALPSLLPSAIEIIDESSSHTSLELLTPLKCGKNFRSRS